jgi:23S rRNA (cytidine1920-2'-O)/16S rRNA (cytidine1409-2'-O)-methyltransferase
MTQKQRLDIQLHERGLAASREKARAMIMAGEVLVEDIQINKPGTLISTNARIDVKSKPRFVSRGGEKLDWAIQTFDLEIRGKTCADVGASTGGFTDCLVQRDARKVYAIDVGYGQFDYTLRQNPHVVVIERTNARYLEKLDEFVDVVTIDASFISLKLLLPSVQRWLQPEADIIPLIKPQFEAGRSEVGKGGVVKDPQVHVRVLHDVLSFATQLSLHIMGLTTSPLKGPAGNTEFLAWLRHTGTAPSEQLDLQALIASVLR